MIINYNRTLKEQNLPKIKKYKNMHNRTFHLMHNYTKPLVTYDLPTNDQPEVILTCGGGGGCSAPFYAKE